MDTGSFLATDRGANLAADNICGQCRFWNEVQTQMLGTKLGEYRARPPQVVMSGPGQMTSCYPPVHDKFLACGLFCEPLQAPDPR